MDTFNYGLLIKYHYWKSVSLLDYRFQYYFKTLIIYIKPAMYNYLHE